MGDIKGDTTSLDYSSCDQGIECECIVHSLDAGAQQKALFDVATHVNTCEP